MHPVCALSLYNFMHYKKESKWLSGEMLKILEEGPSFWLGTCFQRWRPRLSPLRPASARFGPLRPTLPRPCHLDWPELDCKRSICWGWSCPGPNVSSLCLWCITMVLSERSPLLAPSGPHAAKSLPDAGSPLKPGCGCGPRHLVLRPFAKRWCHKQGSNPRKCRTFILRWLFTVFIIMRGGE